MRLKYVKALQNTGDLSTAEAQARMTIEQSPCGALEIAYLSGVLKAQQRFGEQRDFLDGRVVYCDSDGVRNEYAYFLSTCIDDRYRNGALALDLAAAITSKPGGLRLEYVDTLAAAQAETGDMQGAIQTQQQAIAALERRNASPEVLATYRAHYRSYVKGEPLREP